MASIATYLNTVKPSLRKRFRAMWARIMRDRNFDDTIDTSVALDRLDPRKRRNYEKTFRKHGTLD